jgi:hypothetical protein
MSSWAFCALCVKALVPMTPMMSNFRLQLNVFPDHSVSDLARETSLSTASALRMIAPACTPWSVPPAKGVASKPGHPKSSAIHKLAGRLSHLKLHARSTVAPSMVNH